VLKLQNNAAQVTLHVDQIKLLTSRLHYDKCTLKDKWWHKSGVFTRNWKHVWRASGESKIVVSDIEYW